MKYCQKWRIDKPLMTASGYMSTFQTIKKNLQHKMIDQYLPLFFLSTFTRRWPEKEARFTTKLQPAVEAHYSLAVAKFSSARTTRDTERGDRKGQREFFGI